MAGVEHQDHYKILGLNRKCSQRGIKLAYRRLALEWHPDRNENAAWATKYWKPIENAHYILMDGNKRRGFDYANPIEFSHNDNVLRIIRGAHAGQWNAPFEEETQEKEERERKERETEAKRKREKAEREARAAEAMKAEARWRAAVEAARKAEAERIARQRQEAEARRTAQVERIAREKREAEARRKLAEAARRRAEIERIERARREVEARREAEIERMARERREAEARQRAAEAVRQQAEADRIERERVAKIQLEKEEEAKRQSRWAIGARNFHEEITIAKGRIWELENQVRVLDSTDEDAVLQRHRDCRIGGLSSSRFYDRPTPQVKSSRERARLERDRRRGEMLKETEEYWERVKPLNGHRDDLWESIWLPKRNVVGSLWHQDELRKEISSHREARQARDFQATKDKFARKEAASIHSKDRQTKLAVVEREELYYQAARDAETRAN